MKEAKPCIFVSATTSDLGSYRRIASVALKRGGLDPICQDHDFTADYRPLPVFLRDEIEACDAVVCLVGHLYGSEPESEQGRKRRSYTQYEYTYAVELGKPIWVFLAHESCPPDNPINQSDEEKELQIEYRKELLKKHKPAIFDSVLSLQQFISEVTEKIKDETSLQKSLPRIVTRHFPTPLSNSFKDTFEDSASANYICALYEDTLRFIALLAIQDALANGAFANETTNIIKILSSPEPKKWIELIDHAYLNIDEKALILPELKYWYQNHLTSINLLNSYYETIFNTLTRRRGPNPETVANLKEGLFELYKDISFLKYYLLLAISDINLSENVANAWIFQGNQPQKILLKFNNIPSAKHFWAAGKMFLLSPYESCGFQLNPAFRQLKDEPNPPEIAALEIFNYRENRFNRAEFMVFSTDKKIIITEEDASTNGQEMPTDSNIYIYESIAIPFANWLGIDLAKESLETNINTNADKTMRRLECGYLSEDTWKILRNIALPPDSLGIIGGKYCLEKPCLHKGAYADLFKAEVKSDTKVSPVIVHLLRKEYLGHKPSHNWFKYRFTNWRKINHPVVLRPHDDSDTESTQPSPYFAVDYKEEAQSLEEIMYGIERLENTKIIEIFQKAAEVCREAHSNGLRLLCLPLRHFFLDSAEKIWLTGFDFVYQSETGNKIPEIKPRDIWQRFPKDRLDFAPETRTTNTYLPQSVDIFALGVLLNRLLNQPFKPLTHISDCSVADCHFKLLEFHCLANNPALRFQNIDHLFLFFKDWFGRSEEEPPKTVWIPPGEVILHTGPKEYLPGFHMGKYPVTNAEYEYFCRSENHNLPYLWQYDSNSEPDTWINAPLCPVVGVSWEDAQAFCKWLSRKTGKEWRLPLEKEWIRAARLDKSHKFPWGDNAPNENYANFGSHFAVPIAVGAYLLGSSGGGCMDMVGNIWEWCDEWEHNSPRKIMKGGSYDWGEDSLNIESYRSEIINYRSLNTGFRVLCEERS